MAMYAWAGSYSSVEALYMAMSVPDMVGPVGALESSTLALLALEN